MLIYMILDSIWETKNIRFFHATGIILLIGLVIGYLIEAFSENGLPFEIDANFFFRFTLPLILFSEGYNMHQREFFSKLRISFIYGVNIVLLQFSLHVLLTWSVLEIYKKIIGGCTLVLEEDPTYTG